MFILIETIDFGILLFLLIIKFYFPSYKDLFYIKFSFPEGEILLYFIIKKYLLNFPYLIKKENNNMKIVFLRICFIIFIYLILGIIFFIFGNFIWVFTFFINILWFYVGEKKLSKKIDKKELYVNLIYIGIYSSIVLVFALSVGR